MKTLTLALQRYYFEAIAKGDKGEEYRLVTPYWTKRLQGRHYDRIVLTLGYPSAADSNKRLSRVWNGYVVKTITHPHFGKDPVQVYAIDVSELA